MAPSRVTQAEQEKSTGEVESHLDSLENKFDIDAASKANITTITSPTFNRNLAKS